MNSLQETPNRRRILRLLSAAAAGFLGGSAIGFTAPAMAQTPTRPPPLRDSRNTERFDTALAIVLGFEGGCVEDAVDGGRTAYGIRQEVYTSWRRQQGLPDRDVFQIAPDEVRAIYRWRYWEQIHGEDLPVVLGMVVFDAAVLHGPSRSLAFLASALETECGLHIPPAAGIDALVQASKNCPPRALALNIQAQRRAFCDKLIKRQPEKTKYAQGWANRFGKLEALLPA